MQSNTENIVIILIKNEQINSNFALTNTLCVDMPLNK